jgi:dissimilatory sulfite reductase related protein
MTLKVGDNVVSVDEEGYLVDPADWNKEVAEELARQEDITLIKDHWKLLHFMRQYYDEHGIIPDARFAIKFLAEDLGKGRQARSYLFKIFPYGYVKQACKIAGMRRPRAWSTG